jgi:hypothetical protein
MTWLAVGLFLLSILLFLSQVQINLGPTISPDCEGCLPVVFAENIPFATEYNWRDFSYGDAAFTLVEVAQLLNELIWDEGCPLAADEYAKLLDALEGLEPETLVAFEG